jgi:hypothetical protein
MHPFGAECARLRQGAQARVTSPRRERPLFVSELRLSGVRFGPIADTSQFPPRPWTACANIRFTASKFVSGGHLRRGIAVEAVCKNAIEHHFERADIARETLRPLQSTLIDWQTA